MTQRDSTAGPRPESGAATGTKRPLVAVVLAAGQGTRMRSALPKVLHEVAGEPMLASVVATARRAGCARILVVVGHGAESVRAAFPDPDLEWVEQPEQRGTGDALARAVSHLDAPALLLVLSGDVPLVRPETLAALVERARGAWGALAVARHERPGSLGRVLLDEGGRLERIVEAADATPEELAVDRVNAGLYALPAPEIFAELARLEPDNARGELYLTDALGAAAARGERLEALVLDDPAEAYGVNDRRDLARVHRALQRRRADELMASGVTVLEPDRTIVGAAVEVGEESVLHPGVTLLGRTRIGRGCALRQGAWLRDTVLGDEVVVEPYSVMDGARIGRGCRVGPFARLRPGAELGEGARVGNFVEVKNSRLGQGVKAGHLTYLGDAEVGPGANIGAGTVTCNYDGRAKHKTTIGARAFIGSDTMLVAPVAVGEEASTGAGSVISRDVPPGSLAVERAPQRTIPGWSKRRAPKPAAPKPAAPEPAAPEGATPSGGDEPDRKPEGEPT